MRSIRNELGVGHTIVNDLPRTRRWNRVFDLLQSSEISPRLVADATERAASARLDRLRGDPSLTYCFWILTRLAAAARGPDFAADMHQLGIPVTPGDHALTLIARVNERVRHELRQWPQSGPFGELAANALRISLTDTLGAQHLSLFESSVEDIARAFRRHSTASQFGELATRFFGAYGAQILRYYVDRALPAAVDLNGGLRSLADLTAFQAALDRHARESAQIVDLFATQWWVKHQGIAGEPISRDEAAGFSAHALRKLRSELERAAR